MLNIKNYMQLTKQQRQSHLNINSSCIPSVMKRVYKNKKIGDYTSPNIGGCNAKQALLEYYQINDFHGWADKIHTCHSCSNGSHAPNGFVCINPQHLYFGTHSENMQDKTDVMKKKGPSLGGKIASGKGAKKAIKKGNHMNMQKVKCIHCNTENNPGVIARYHNHNCKFKP